MDQETSTKRDVIIIAGGPSVKDIPAATLKDYGYVIGVNESAILFPCDEALSMDRLWMEARYEQLQWMEIPTFFRRCAWKVGIEWPNLTQFNGDIKASGLSDSRDTLFGRNSGQCAINRAYHIEPDRIFLFGFDMKSDNKSHYFYDQSDLVEKKRGLTNKKIKPPTDTRYLEWMPAFKSIASKLSESGIKTYNVYPDSAVQDFEKISWSDFKRMF